MCQFLTQSSDATNGVTYTPDASKGTQEGLNNLDQLPFGDKVKAWTAKDSLGGTAKSWKHSPMMQMVQSQRSKQSKKNY